MDAPTMVPMSDEGSAEDLSGEFGRDFVFEAFGDEHADAGSCCGRSGADGEGREDVFEAALGVGLAAGEEGDGEDEAALLQNEVEDVGRHGEDAERAAGDACCCPRNGSRSRRS